MKIRIEIEVGPTELREFLGLPDVSGLQEDVIDAVRHRVTSGASSVDPLALLQTWIPKDVLSVGEWQKVLRRAIEAAQITTEPATAAPARKRKKKKAAS